MDGVGILNAPKLGENPIDDDIQIYRDEIGGCYKNFDKSRRVNRQLDISFTAVSIVLTMLTAVVAVFGEGSILRFYQKVLVGVLGAASVAVQTAAAKFPVQERAKKYLQLRNAIRGLVLDLGDAQSVQDLKTIKEKYVAILRLEAEIP